MGRILILLLLVWAGPTAAQDLSFDIRTAGLTIGRFDLTHHRDGTAGRFKTTGLAGMLARVHFSIQRHGADYHARLHTGRKARQDKARFAADSDKTDPASALWAVLRDRPATQGCAAQHVIFDGKRKLTLTLRQKGAHRCIGQLVRRAGYTADEIAQASTFPVTLWLAPHGDLLRVRKARVGTIHGKVTLHRRD